LDNGVEVELVDVERMKEIEPLAKANDKFRFALYSPNAAVSSIDGVLRSVRKELSQLDNLEINTGTRFLKKGNQYLDTDEIITNKGNIEAKIVINVAGHDCLRVAQQFGLGEEYQMFPLRGFYLKAPVDLLTQGGYRYPETLLYPVPPERSALFLGSHTTTTTDGYFKIGPTAIPGLSGRHFSTFSKFSLSEAAKTLQLAGSLLFHADFGYYWKMLREQ
jgi:L-2-hydroxyglutarate oxidase LhgO